MECGEVSQEARSLAVEDDEDQMVGCELEAAEEEEDHRIVECELEAAEALAGLARYSSVHGDAELKRSSQQLVTDAVVVSSRLSQDQTVAAQQFCGYTSSTTTRHEKTAQTGEAVRSQLCSTSYQSHPVRKSRPNLTKAEKEAQRIRRVLANRESARETIRRRQAMHLDLTRRAADVLEENENLKKGKELAMEEYNSLKSRNEFLKAKLAKKRAKPGKIQEEPNASQAEISSSATISTPVFSHNQPSLSPCFWPSILQYSDISQFQCASHSNVTSSSQFPRPHRDIHSAHQGQETSIGITTRPEIPFFVLPVPWLLPFLTHSSTLPSHSGTNDIPNSHQCSTCMSSDTMLHESNNHLSSTQNTSAKASNSTKTMSWGTVHGAEFAFSPDCVGQYTGHHRTNLVPGPFSCVRPVESLRRNSQIDVTSDVNVVSAPDIARQGLSQKNQGPIICPPKKPEDVVAATEARRKRKELMKLKNIHCHHIHSRY